MSPAAAGASSTHAYLCIVVGCFLLGCCTPAMASHSPPSARSIQTAAAGKTSTQQGASSCGCSRMCFAGPGFLPTHGSGAHALGANQWLQGGALLSLRNDESAVGGRGCSYRACTTMKAPPKAKRRATSKPTKKKGVGKKVRRILEPASPAEVCFMSLLDTVARKQCCLRQAVLTTNGVQRTVKLQ